MKRKHLKESENDCIEKKVKVESVDVNEESNLHEKKSKKKKKNIDYEKGENVENEISEDSFTSNKQKVSKVCEKIEDVQSDSMNEISKNDDQLEGGTKKSSKKQKSQVECKSDTKKKKKKDKQIEKDNEEACESDITEPKTDKEISDNVEKKVKKKKNKNKVKKTDVTRDGDKTEPEKSAKDLAIEYLKQWKKNREAWKFQKVRQVWLLNHMYSKDMLKDKHFNILLPYLDGMKGKSRETTSNDAQKVIDSDCTDEAKIERARQIVQQLSTD